MEGKAEKKFRDLGKKLDQMLEDLNELKDNISHKYGDRWEEINRNKDKMEEELHQFRERNKERFEEAETYLERAGSEIKKAFETIFSRKTKSSSSEKTTTGGGTKETTDK